MKKTTLKFIKENKVFYFGEGVYKHCFYEYVGYRCPDRGEFYLSGAVTEAYRAFADLSACYHIVRPTDQAIPAKAWTHGEKVEVRELVD